MNPIANHTPAAYTLVPTNVAPSYAFLQTENAYLRQSIEWRDAMLIEQQGKIDSLQTANAQLQHDAARWNKFKGIIDSQKGELSSKQLQNIVDAGNRNG